MRKLFIISLLSIHLLGNTEFNQVLHLPNLVAHYAHHLNNGEKISFSDFVSEHYGKGDLDPTDDNEEKEMPFMQVHHHGFSIAILPHVDPPVSDLPNFHSYKKAEKFISVKLPVGFFCAVIKPPRAVA